MESRLGGEGRKGGLCSLCNREWPGVCCSSGNVARCQKVGGWKRVRVGGDDMEEGGGKGVAGTCHFEERRGGEGMDLYIGAATIFPN